MARILGTVSSGYVEQVYELSQTFNTSGTYTVPAGKTQVAVICIGAGGGGGAGAGHNMGGAGGGAGTGNITEHSVTSGANYTVTVGSGGMVDHGRMVLVMLEEHLLLEI
jgi:hypothetical protein